MCRCEKGILSIRSACGWNRPIDAVDLRGWQATPCTEAEIRAPSASAGSSRSDYELDPSLALRALIQALGRDCVLSVSGEFCGGSLGARCVPSLQFTALGGMGKYSCPWASRRHWPRRPRLHSLTSARADDNVRLRLESAYRCGRIARVAWASTHARGQMGSPR